jgi:hypothetical protein
MQNLIMKAIESKTFLASAIICTLAFTSTQAADVTPAEARVIARDAYIFAYPLAMQYHTMYVQAIDSNSKEYVGGFGKYRHYGISTPDNKDIVTPNNDTPYSWAHVDLRAEPWVLSLPQTDGRYFTTQWMDLWHFIVDNPGSVLDGSEGGNFLLAAPGWKGEVPKGIKRIVRGESDFMGTLTRTQLKGIDDLPAMQKTQQGYKLQPLSAFLGQKASAPAPEIEWPVWIDKVDRTADIFRYVNFMLPYTTPNVLDRPILERIAKIGIGPGKPWNLAELKPEIRRAIEEGVADGLKLIGETIPKVRDAAKLYLSRANMQTDYLNRTMGVVIGQWGNDTRQAVYQGWPLDAEGVPPDSSKNKYTITFLPGQLPNYRFFWSITMYGLPERLLVNNPIKRYSIGSNSPDLKIAADGSMVIYLQKDSPGLDKEANWLPAPDSPFSAVLRVYGPGEAEQVGKWKALALERVK